MYIYFLCVCAYHPSIYICIYIYIYIHMLWIGLNMGYSKNLSASPSVKTTWGSLTTFPMKQPHVLAYTFFRHTQSHSYLSSIVYLCVFCTCCLHVAVVSFLSVDLSEPLQKLHPEQKSKTKSTSLKYRTYASGWFVAHKLAISTAD